MEEKRNIVLVGFMGTGKTVVGKALASALGFKYVDTDLLIEQIAKKSIPEIFAEEGEPKFREYETRAIGMIMHLKDHVIATGGGAVMLDENVQNMKRTGLVVCLTATPEVIYQRTRKDDYRPLLRTPDPLKKIKSLLKIRDSQYRKADYTIDTSNLSVDAVVEAIIELWNSHK